METFNGLQVSKQNSFIFSANCCIFGMNEHKLKMKNIIYALIVCFGFCKINAQVVTAASTPTNLVQNVLLGTGVTASNITYTGYANAISSFTASASTNLGISSGVYLTSGSYLQNDPLGFGGGQDGPLGPSSNFQSISNGAAGDPYLDAISGNTTFDAAILEFDFVPQSDTVKFRYTFGSEEYNDYVGSTVNDAFAFVLSGVSTPLAPVNLALIPGSAIPVSINTVNNGNSFAASTGPCTNCAYFRDNFNGTIDVTYDGMTVVLTAVHPVICGETYHIKIMISDAGDEAFDSGVFLEAGSFSSSVPLSIATSVNGNYNDTIAAEGCDQIKLDFIRSLTDTANATSYTVTIGGSAVNGIDYTTLSSTINFPVGEDTVSYILNPLADANVEAMENVSITISNITVCGLVTSVTYNFYIEDTPPIVVTASNDTTICPGVSASLFATASGGSGTPYTYTWTGGLGAGTNVVATPNSTTTYTVTVDDNCPSSPAVSEQITINVVPTFVLSIPNQDTVFCSNEGVVNINAVTTPATPGTWSVLTGLTDLGGGQASINTSLAPLGNSTLIFTAGGAGGCGDKDTVTIVINPFVGSSFNAIPSFCANSTSVTANPLNTGGVWYLDNVIFNGTVDPTLLTVGTHDIKYVIGGPTCPDSTTQQFTVNPLPIIDFTVDTTEGCLVGGNVFSFQSVLTNPTVAGGTYNWSFNGTANSTLQNPVHLFSQAGTYNVSLNYTDPNGCQGSVAHNSFITVHPMPVANFYASNYSPSDIEPEVNFINTSSGAISYVWNIADLDTFTTTNANYTFDNSGIYPITLIATNQFNCTDTITQEIEYTIDFTFYVPNSFTPNKNYGLNSTFHAECVGINYTQGYTMLIYDRWGEKLYETTDYYSGWNGTKNNSGGKTFQDVYIYKFTFKDLKGRTYTRTGTVTLL